MTLQPASPRFRADVRPNLGKSSPFVPAWERAGSEVGDVRETREVLRTSEDERDGGVRVQAPAEVRVVRQREMSSPPRSACCAMRSSSSASSMSLCAPKPKMTSRADKVLPIQLRGRIQAAVGPNCSVKRSVNRSAPLYWETVVAGTTAGPSGVGQLAGTAARPEREQDHRVGQGPVGGCGLLVAQLGGDVLRHDLGVLHRVPGHLGFGDIGDVADRVDVVVPADVEGLGDGDLPLRSAGREPAVSQVVAVDAHAVGVEPDVGSDLLPAGGGNGEGPDPTGLVRRRRCQAGAKPQLNVQLLELAVQVGAHLRPEGGQQLLGRVDDSHVLVWPDLLDLAGQFHTDRPGAEDQHPLGVGQSLWLWRRSSSASLVESALGLAG